MALEPVWLGMWTGKMNPSSFSLRAMGCTIDNTFACLVGIHGIVVIGNSTQYVEYDTQASTSTAMAIFGMTLTSICYHHPILRWLTTQRNGLRHLPFHLLHMPQDLYDYSLKMEMQCSRHLIRPEYHVPHPHLSFAIPI